MDKLHLIDAKMIIEGETFTSEQFKKIANL